MLPDGEIKAVLPSVADVFGMPVKRAKRPSPGLWAHEMAWQEAHYKH
jgi:hypothetical protein